MFVDAEFIPPARESGCEKWNIPEPVEFLKSLALAYDRESERMQARLKCLMRWLVRPKEKIA